MLALLAVGTSVDTAFGIGAVSVSVMGFPKRLDKWGVFRYPTRALSIIVSPFHTVLSL